MTRHLFALLVLGSIAGCDRSQSGSTAAPTRDGADAQVTTLGDTEVTALLVEVPAGAIFRRELYDYATVLKYQVQTVHRGAMAPGATIYVCHYNPFKPRADAKDRFVKDVGGDLLRFRAGDRHRMALRAPVDDYYMGGLVNKYFTANTGPLYWAFWTNQVLP